MAPPIVPSHFFSFGDPDHPVPLGSGSVLPEITVAYETYGTLSPAKDNAVLVFHALSGSQHAAGYNPSVEEAGPYWQKECHIGWWDDFVGPGKAIDTDQFFVICANYLGGCYGTTGPSSIHPLTGRAYGGDFPQLTLTDIVDSQLRLLDDLGIDTLHATFGGSLGGMMAINLAARFPHRVKHIVPIATAMEISVLQQILNFEQIAAIEMDPHFSDGHYYDGQSPEAGLALARMIAHKTYVSLRRMSKRARREVTQPGEGLAHYKLTHPVESYMFHHGQKFVHRFDANTYLRIVDAWRRYHLKDEAGVENVSELLQHCKHQTYTVFSIDTDVCFYPEEQDALCRILEENELQCERVDLHSVNGHDAFLLEPELFAPHFQKVLNRD